MLTSYARQSSSSTPRQTRRISRRSARPICPLSVRHLLSTIRVEMLTVLIDSLARLVGVREAHHVGRPTAELPRPVRLGHSLDRFIDDGIGDQLAPKPHPDDQTSLRAPFSRICSRSARPWTLLPLFVLFLCPPAAYILLVTTRLSSPLSPRTPKTTPATVLPRRTKISLRASQQQHYSR